MCDEQFEKAFDIADFDQDGAVDKQEMVELAMMIIDSEKTSPLQKVRAKSLKDKATKARVKAAKLKAKADRSAANAAVAAADAVAAGTPPSCSG